MAAPQPRNIIRRRSDLDQGTWTASRCNRLLRQVRLHIQVLRQNTAETEARSASGLKRKSLETLRTPVPKRARKKYGGRKHRTANARGPLAEIPPNVSTPPRILRKMGDTRPSAQFSSPSGMACPTPIRPQRRPDHDTTELQHRRTSSRAHKKPKAHGLGPPCVVLIPWLQALLHVSTTQEREADGSKDYGDDRYTTVRDVPEKSLIGMCLRRVPDCVAQVQHWDRQAGEEAGTWTVWDDAKAETAMYQELQSTFESTHDGWPPFRQLARGHVVAIIADATKEGIVASSTALELAALCDRYDCHDEAAKLIAAAATLESEHHASNQEKKASPHMTEQQAGAHWSSTCWIAEDLVCEERISVAELYSSSAAELTPGLSALWGTSFWTHNLTSITEPVCSPKICSFVASALVQLASPHAAGSWSKTLLKERSLISIAAGLAAAATAGDCTRVQRRVVHILDTAIADLRAGSLRSFKSEKSGLYLLTLTRHTALGLDGCGFELLRSQSMEELQSLISPSDLQITYRQTIALTCSVARACSETTKIASHEVLDRLRSLLEPLAFPAWFHAGLRRDGAFILAQRTKDLRDLAYAENLTGTPAEMDSLMFSGWKWEPGISEWVPQTPAKSTAADVSGCPPAEKTALRESDPSSNASNKLLMQPPRRLRSNLLRGQRHSEGCRRLATETDDRSVDAGQDGNNLSCVASEPAPESSYGLLAAPKRAIRGVARPVQRPCPRKGSAPKEGSSTDDADSDGFDGSTVSHVAGSRPRGARSELRNSVSTITGSSSGGNQNLKHDGPDSDGSSIRKGATRNAKVEETSEARQIGAANDKRERQTHLTRPSRRQHSQVRRTVSLASLSQSRSPGGRDVGSDDWDELG